ncbi:MAG: tetratricopeptide repeat protein [Thermoanaerobaculia bacterium]|nr:tetratricopeptide repeat protein [Thermoanaerobaculia bacterium]
MATDRLRAFLLPLALCTVLAGCGKVQARVEFKQGNSSYKTENYRDAIKYYKRGLELDPAATQVWRSVGLAAMAVYRPGDTSKSNLAYAEEALEAFEKFAQAYPEDAKVQDYILTILMSSERFDDALKRLRARSAKNPNDKDNNQAIVTVLIRAGKLDEALAYVKSLGARADGISHYSVGVAAWDKAYHDPMLSPEQRGVIVDAGIEALRKSVAMTPDSFDSLVYLNLILREKAKLEVDPVKQQELIAEAVIYQDKAKAIVAARKAQAAAAS